MQKNNIFWKKVYNEHDEILTLSRILKEGLLDEHYYFGEWPIKISLYLEIFILFV